MKKTNKIDELDDLVYLHPRWSLREYADRLGMSYAAISAHIYRAGRRLQDYENRPGVHGATHCTSCGACQPGLGRTAWRKRATSSS